MNQWNSIENPEGAPQMYGELIFDKTGKTIQRIEDSLFTKGAGRTEQQHDEE